MKKLIFIALIVLISCDSKTDNNNDTKEEIKEAATVAKKHSDLYIKTNTYTSRGDKHQSFDTISVVSLEYFEVDLYQKGSIYYTEKTIKEPDIYADSTSSIYFKITTKGGEVIGFKNPTEFLNHVSKCGYDLKDQIRNGKYVTYTFKKI